MKYTILLIMIPFYMVLPYGKFYCQTDSVYSFSLPELTITQIENGRQVSYKFEKEHNLFTMKDSLLTADPNKYKFSVNINDVSRLRFDRGKSILTVTAISFGVGFLIGYTIVGFDIGGGHDVSTGRRILAGSVAGLGTAILGGAVTILFSLDKIYDISKFSFTVKKRHLLKAFRENKL